MLFVRGKFVNKQLKYQKQTVRIKEEDRKRKFREGKSKKLGYVCSSKLIVRKHGKDGHVNWKKLNGRKDADGFLTDSERVPISSGQTSVLYHHSHSHPVIDEHVVRETPISEQTRKVVRVWRALGMSVDEIYDNLVLSRDSAHSEALGLGVPTAREKQISKRDLRNILVACNMYRRDAPRQDDITDNDIRAGDLLVRELKDTYGTGEGPIPPPLWGQPHPVEDAQAAHAMIKIYQNLTEASVHMDELVGSMERAEMFMSYKQRIDIIRTSMLMTTCKRLLFPNFPGFTSGASVAENDENLGLATGFQFQTAPPKGGKHEQHYVV